MYVQVGANCNICEINPGTHGQIRRYNADGTGMEIVARGVRNTVGFDWHPVTKELWFTDNGRDWAGDAGPEDELNRIAKGKEGANFGFPYCHANGIPDPDVKRPNPCAGVVLPAALTGPHAAGLGIKFYTGNMFPKSYQNVAFIARRGSWNREQKFGYDVVVARTSGGKAKIEPFLTGLLDEKANEFHGRPTYVLPDEGRLAAGLRRAERRGLPHHLRRARQQAGNDGVMRCVANGWRPLVLGLAAAVLLRGARAAGAEHAARRADPALRRLPRRGRQLARWRRSRRSPASRRSSSLNQLFLMREGVRKVEAMAPFVKDLKDDDLDGAVGALRQACRPSAAMSRSIRRWPSAARRSRRSGAAAPATCRPWPARSRCRGSRSSASTT